MPELALASCECRREETVDFIPSSDELGGGRDPDRRVGNILACDGSRIAAVPGRVISVLE